MAKQRIIKARQGGRAKFGDQPKIVREAVAHKLSELEYQLNWLIAAVPTGEARNKLTEMNILRLQVIEELSK